MENKEHILIKSGNTELTEGLFGCILLFVMEILPLFENRDDIIPYFDIKSNKYGNVIPDLIKQRNNNDDVIKKEIWFNHVRSNENLYVLGDNFQELNKLFHKYFYVNEDIYITIDNIIHTSKVGNFKNTLGVHYRGTDKNLDTAQTNPVSFEYMCFIIKDYLDTNDNYKNINQIYLATDQNEFINCLNTFINENYKHINILNCGDVMYWNSYLSNDKKKFDALRDCLLLSKCKTVLKCQSGLSAFSKLFNPDLEIYRINASKKFADIPYWPDAYIPKYKSCNPETQHFINIMMKDDWSLNEENIKKFSNFTYKKRYQNN